MYDGKQQPGRNDACWCGSGKKYKKCHLDIDERPAKPSTTRALRFPIARCSRPRPTSRASSAAPSSTSAVLDYVAERIGPGVTTEQVDRWVHDYTVESAAAFRPTSGTEGYPKSVCTSVNEVVCHGIPSEADVLREGDIVNVDCSTILDGYYSDSSRMFLHRRGVAGAPPPREETKRAMEAGLARRECPGAFWGDVGAAVNATPSRAGSPWCANSAATHRPRFPRGSVREPRVPGRHGHGARAGAHVHHRAHGERRRSGDRHERPERLGPCAPPTAATPPNGRSS